MSEEKEIWTCEGEGTEEVVRQCVTGHSYNEFKRAPNESDETFVKKLRKFVDSSNFCDEESQGWSDLWLQCKGPNGKTFEFDRSML